jgi:carbon storage regulator
MLVLSRQVDETIMIGDDIEITIVDIRGDKVRLGISAPTRIAVHRKEVYEAIKLENQKAAASSSQLGGDVLPTVRPAAQGRGNGGRDAKQTAGRINALTSPPIRPGVPGAVRNGPHPVSRATGTDGLASPIQDLSKSSSRR